MLIIICIVVFIALLVWVMLNRFKNSKAVDQAIETRKANELLLIGASSSGVLKVDNERIEFTCNGKTKTALIRNVRSVNIISPSAGNGTLEISVGDSPSSFVHLGMGVTTADTGAIKILFSKKDTGVAESVKRRILHVVDTGNQPSQQISDADEIKKLKELLDNGAITQDEYDAKKKQILGI